MILILKTDTSKISCASYYYCKKPLHVAIGLEKNVNNDDDADKDAPPFLVTFEGSARGLHFDAVDTVFIVGRPASAASYLHLAGRVGRSSTSTNGDGSVVIRPGTVVSMCTKGSATELEKWTRQIGGTTLEELVLLQ
jgi:superfamily II DNA/RNA helicase